MDLGTRARLERYFRNATPFMWGVIPGDKRAVVMALRTVLEELCEDTELIANHKKPTYAMVTENLLAKLGIERILNQIVAKEVGHQFTGRTGALDFLRAHWMSGTLPRWQTLQSLRTPKTVKQKLADSVVWRENPERRQQTSDILDAFVEINNQYKYVHGWTVFAGLWFEEIEPLLKETKV